MNIKQVTDSNFGKYGRVLDGFNLDQITKEMSYTPLPADVVYVGSVEEFEALPIAKELKERAFGGMPIQIGYCNGDSKTLNALEYHRDSEVVIAITDMILLVGSQQDISVDFTYDTANIEAFYVPANHVVELFATTLHYAPSTAVEGGFRCVVVLPKGTNSDLTFTPGTTGEDKLITHTNKWLIAHPEAKIEGAHEGLIGENITLS